MEAEKKSLTNQGLPLHCEEVNEVMGRIPHHIFRAGTIIIICIVVLLAATGYMLQVPSYIEVPYIVFRNIPSVGIVSKSAGMVMFRYNRPHHVEVGDTVATIMKGDEDVCYISPMRGIVESNFLYTTGDYIASGDTLARIISRNFSGYKLMLKIPLNMKSTVKSGMRVKFTTEGVTAENALGYIKKVSMIPDGSNCYNAIVEMPTSIIQKLPASGKAKLCYKTENVFEKILTTKQVSPHPPA